MLKYQLYKKLAEVTEVVSDQLYILHSKVYDLQSYLRDLQLAELNEALAEAEFSESTNQLFKKVFG